MLTQRRLPLPTILTLLAALVLSPALETHGSRGHLADSGAGFNDGSVYVAGHDRVDDSLHIELLGGIESSHCVGCLLRPTRSGLAIQRQLAARRIVGAPVSTSASDTLPIDPLMASGSPRAPPLA